MVDIKETGAASERIAEYLRSAILDGDIPPGTRLRQEEIAERLGSSRLPVREALRMLEIEGLTQIEVNKGARVPALDLGQLETLYRMRERLEPLALIASAPLLDDDALARLHRLQDEIEANEDVAAFLRLDRTFHLLSYSACPTPDLLSSVTRLWNSTQHYRRAFMTRSAEDRRWIVNAEHRLLLDAIERRDSVDCERFLSGHIRRTRIQLSLEPEIFIR
ncbi:GntR family transcriptional regulator [Nocardioides sp. LMS-CY]|uniref:GntR family transcriptional regulator n=1 Tax=Nocardioides sp. (strain LMS-CY) TaxID=2840457 RepID=UPI002079F64F|nr:GntR family transcriptional regulator [Nocardioides sp. LMS-CY]